MFPQPESLSPRGRETGSACQLLSKGPGRWPGQSGKELGLTVRFPHSLVEQHATEVSRLGSGVLYHTDS